jgi:hypothetical protein
MSEAVMKAAQARSKAVSIAQKEAAEKSAALKKRRAALKESVPRLRAERIKKIEKKFRDNIEYAVEAGLKQVEITLSSDHHDTLRGEYKYLPQKTSRNYRGEVEHSYYHAWGEGYLKYAAWGKYVKLVLTKLRRDGYKCTIEGENVEHDDSAAYMNSGGECGSETPYWTRNTILTIKW